MSSRAVSVCILCNNTSAPTYEYTHKCFKFTMEKQINYNYPIWLKSGLNSEILYQKLKTIPTINFIEQNNLLTTILTEKLTLLKNQFDNYQYQNIQSAHKKINQYEKIGNLFFQNRAAIKLLNINADIGYILNPNYFNLLDDEIFFFADLCGGTLIK